MKCQRLTGIAIAAVSTLIAQPLWAAPTEITAIQLKPTSMGVELVFDTQGNNRPPIFTVSLGNSSVAEITNTQLRLPGAKSFRQENPAPGITSVEVSQLDPNTIRVVVSGATKAPTGQVVRRDGPGLVLSFNRVPGTTPDQAVTPALSQPPSSGRSPNAIPPILPRAVAPPVGDISVAPINVSPKTIDLGTSERIPKLLLRQAPVQEVLALLARAAGVNLIYIPPAGTPAKLETPPTARTISKDIGGGARETVTTSEGAKPAEPAQQGGYTISLDIEDEPVQDVFNYVLQVSGLQANRVGNTIFVGETLPDSAQNRVVRTYRLNQIKATSTGTITQTFTSQAETGGSVSAGTGEGVTVSSGATAQTAISRTTNIQRTVNDRGAKEILESYGANGGGTASGEAVGPTSTLLRSLEVIADPRANTITLIGTSSVVEAATSLITQIDIRRRQAAINVKIVDVNLLKGRNANSSFNFNSNDTISSGFINGVFQVGAVLGTNFLLNLTASIQDDSAKILTDPTLIVQEGSSAQVNLTQEIFSGIRRETSAVDDGGIATVTESPIIRPAGVILNLNVDQIDDNGFITLNIAPEVSSPSGTFVVNGDVGTLLQQRRLETGQIRLRDGQTLILTGIIQDSDTSSIDKVPILGDIPLLGRLFRRDTKTRQRQEVVVIVTPRIMDDSDQSSYGYQYNPSPEAQKLINPQPPQQR